MFDAPTITDDVPSWSDARYDAWVAELIAAAPDAEAVPWPDRPAVVDDAGPGDAPGVGRTDVAGYDAPGPDGSGVDDAIDRAMLWTRMRNSAGGHLADAVATLVAETQPRVRLSALTLASAELGPALSLGSGAADLLVDVSVALATRLTATLDLVRAGELSWEKATVLAQRTGMLTDEQARRVEQRVLPRAGARTPAQHADAVRRAVDHVDPDGADDRRRKAREDVALIRQHHGDGMGELFARMPSEQLDTVWTGADTWARGRKAGGDERTLDQLRVAALVQWAQSFLHHGDPTYCDRWCDRHDDPSVGTSSQPAPPTRHGRSVALHALWDLASLLGLADGCGELHDSGATLPPDAMRELVARGCTIRRMLIDAQTGELVDLTSRTWRLPARAGGQHAAPVVLGVILDVDTWRALGRGDADRDLARAVDAAPRAVRDLLAHPVTCDALDARPQAYPPPAALADFVAVRDRHPTNPAAGPTAAAACDLDHTISVRDGGTSVRDNLTALTRRWHLLRTFGGWTVRRVGRQWRWTSPSGRAYTTAPHDYRLGP